MHRGSRIGRECQALGFSGACRPEKTKFQWRLMREARYAGTKTKFQWRLVREARYAGTKIE